MNVLLVGGPDHGRVIEVTGDAESRAAVYTEHEGARFEYRRVLFQLRADDKDSYWHVFMRGEPSVNEITAAILSSGIAPIAQESQIPRSRSG